MDNNVMFRKLVAKLLIFLLVVTATPSAFVFADAPQPAADIDFKLTGGVAAPAGGGTLTRAEACERLLAAAGHYAGGVRSQDIMSGYQDGSLRETQAVTRLEALVMVSRAFRDLPEPKGDFLRVSAYAPAYTDIPAWAASDMAKLAAARVLFVVPEDSEDENGASNTPKEVLLYGEQPMPALELDYVLYNIYSLYGTREQDDFYAAVNKQWLDSSSVPDGKRMDSTFDLLGSRTETQIKDIFNEILAGKWEKGTTGRKIVDYYQAAMDIDARDKAGATQIKPYLDKILAASDMKNLEDTLLLVSKDLALNVFFDLTIRPDEYDKTKYSIYLTIPDLNGIEPEADAPETEAFLMNTEKLFKLAGYEKAKEYAASVFKTRVEGARISAGIERAASNQEERDGTLMFFTKLEPRTEKEIRVLFPDVDFTGELAVNELKTEPVWYSAYEGTAIDVWAKYYNKENLEALKIYAAYTLLTDCKGYLGQDFLKTDSYYSEGDYKYAALADAEQIAIPYVEKTYVEKYFSEKSKKDVEAMIKKFIEIYRGRIGNLTWMSEATKKMAQKKLDTMVVKAGYPDNWYDALKNAEIHTVADGGSLLMNAANIRLEKRAHLASKQGKAVDRTEWSDTVTEVNAFYRPDQNEIFFPAAILQPPFYTPGGKQEQNMAGIGWVIGHEITHAFDNSGAQFDEYGNEKNWWTAEDYATFQKLCDEVVKYYDGYEAAPGLLTEGKGTLGENIADLGGISCALQAIAELPNPDYKLFFTSAAKLWICTMERETLIVQVERDPHSPSKARTNKTLATFGEFYKAFDVKAGDGMYVPEENRVKIW